MNQNIELSKVKSRKDRTARIKKLSKRSFVFSATAGVFCLSQALEFGANLAIRRVNDGIKTIALGEMGIGNTSSATLLAHAIEGIPVADMVLAKRFLQSFPNLVVEAGLLPRRDRNSRRKVRARAKPCSQASDEDHYGDPDHTSPPDRCRRDTQGMLLE